MAPLLRKQIYGKIKQAVITAFASDQTYAAVQAQHGFRRASIYNAAKQLGLTLKRKRAERADASIAQSVEHPPCKRKVVGSTPTAGSTPPTNA